MLALDGGSREALIAQTPELGVLLIDEMRRGGEGSDGKGGDTAVCEAMLALDGGSRAALIAQTPELGVLLLDEVRRAGSDIAVHTALVGLDGVTQTRMLQQPKVRDQFLVDLRVLENRNAGEGANALLQLKSKRARINFLAGDIDIIVFYLRSASAAAKLAGPCKNSRSSASIAGHVANGLTEFIDEKTDGNQVSGRWLVSRCSVCM
jgi:hypothetical protein